MQGAYQLRPGLRRLRKGPWGLAPCLVQQALSPTSPIHPWEPVNQPKCDLLPWGTAETLASKPPEQSLWPRQKAQR